MNLDRVAVLFDHLGPYHLARLQAASQFLKIAAIEASSISHDYDWSTTPHPQSLTFDRITLFPDKSSRSVSRRDIFQATTECLRKVSPSVVAIPGWSDPISTSAMYWCIKSRVPFVLMSETAASDALRSTWKEAVKKRLVKRAGSALVGGERHRDYLECLGMSRERIFLGYDVVDNDYFRQGANQVRANPDLWRAKLHLPAKYFLASARFIPKKNLIHLIEAYAVYRSRRKNRHLFDGSAPWDLVLLGDGPMRGRIQQTLHRLDLSGSVHLPGFQQYPLLPAFYGLASAFVHASTVEQWGLVVNEAMASGLPVLVSERCGCVPELVRNAGNGFTFDPSDTEQLVTYLEYFSTHEAKLPSMSQASLRIISLWTPQRFAQALKDAVITASTATPQSLPVLDAVILRGLLCRA